MTELKKLAEVADGIRIAMLTTKGVGGLSGRPLAVQRIDDDDTVWFLVVDDADWLPDLAGDDVHLAFVDDDTWVSATGPAQVVRDAGVLEDLGDPVSSTWFQEDVDPVAVRVDVRTGDWWTSPGTVAMALDLVRAKVSGRQPDAGQRGKVL